jgi:prepilin-type N-terminal cleavage/methylation domain-containing protein
MRNEQPVATEAGLSPFRLPPSAFYRRPGFTLVELLVVITIIGILAALLLAAIQRARVAAQRARISTEINQMDAAIKDLKNSAGSFPPNAQTDGNTGTLVENTVLTDFKQFMLKVAPQHREPDALIAGLVGLLPNGTTPAVTSGDAVLDGGMTASEAIVFWLGGFSSDPKYPISGPSGPSYKVADRTEYDSDPIDNRKWRLGVKVENLGPRGDDDYFSNTYERYIVYTDPRDGSTLRRINMWVLTPPGLPTTYTYFDTSRGTGVTAANDVPAATSAVNHAGAGDLLESLDPIKQVYAIKERATAGQGYQFANKGAFQILHSGFDREWLLIDAGGNALDFPHVRPDGTMFPTETLYPAGPWTGELADTQTNFAENTLESSQQ